MRIKIVYNPNKNDVLSRLAIALTEGTGWDIGKGFDKSYDINYAMLYIQVAQAVEKNQLQGMRVGAWYSHYDKDIPKKVEWWDIAALRCDIRTTTAPMYRDMLDEKYSGVTHLVQPPIDPQFVDNRIFRIGISGMVHPAGRKGESLAFRLNRELPDNWQLVASGKGWGDIPHKFYNWKELPQFYRSLDCFLCTSIIEGVPMPPLEAMGLNIPIVIPYEVGMLDNIVMLGDKGVFRYRKGDYADMLRVLNDAYDWIRARSEYARQYSVSRWIDDHKRAFGLLDKPIEVRKPTILEMVNEDRDESHLFETEWFKKQREKHENDDDMWVTEYKPFTQEIVNELIKNKQHITDNDIEWANEQIRDYFPQYSNNPYPYVEVTTKRSKIKSACVVYIAYGKPARDMCVKAMESWKAHMKEDCILISDNPLGIEDVFIHHHDADIGARSIKTRLLEIVPKKYKYIIYLDADTEVLGDVSFLFNQVKSGYDFAICRNPPKYYSIGEHRRPDNMQETDETIAMIGNDEMPMYNGGVFAVHRNETTENLFAKWYEEWNKYGARDQSSLLRALYQVPTKILYLNQSWNTIIRYVDERITCGILHYPQSARRWTGAIDGRLDSDNAWNAVKRWENEQ